MTASRITIGRIVGLFGVRGWVKVYSYTRPREAILNYDPWWVGVDEDWRSAEVAGVRLPDLSDEGFEDFKQALDHHKMLFRKDQHLSHAEHEEFGARLGPFAVDAYTQGVPGHREVLVVTTAPPSSRHRRR